MSINKFGTAIVPADCNTAVLFPALEADQNCTTSSSIGILSQVSDIYFRFDEATVAVPASFTTANMLTYLSAEVDNANTDNTKLKWIVVEGGVADPDETVQELPKNKEKITKRTYTLTASVANLSDQNREFLRHLQAGSTSFTFWYVTVGGKMFGSVNGITPKSANARLPLGAGREDTEVGTIILTFEADIDPERIDSPV